LDIGGSRATMAAVMLSSQPKTVRGMQPEIVKRTVEDGSNLGNGAFASLRHLASGSMATSETYLVTESVSKTDDPYTAESPCSSTMRGTSRHRNLSVHLPELIQSNETSPSLS
jgi:hypothetical protein